MQLANFYGPRSGGLRTAVDQLGAGYVAGGHEVTLIVPGAQWREELLPSGVVRIEVPAPQIPCTGGYRVADPRRVSSVASGLRPDVIEVSDRLTLRGMGRWAARRDIRSVMISHERLDRLFAQTMPDPSPIWRTGAPPSNTTPSCAPRSSLSRSSSASVFATCTGCLSGWIWTCSIRGADTSRSARHRRNGYWCTAADCRWKSTSREVSIRLLRCVTQEFPRD